MKKTSKPKPAPKRKPNLPAQLTEVQEDLLNHLQEGYQIETSSLEEGPVLRRLKDNTVLRTASANRSTIAALEERGLIEQVKGPDPLTMVWRATKASK